MKQRVWPLREQSTDSDGEAWCRWVPRMAITRKSRRPAAGAVPAESNPRARCPRAKATATASSIMLRAGGGDLPDHARHESSELPCRPPRAGRMGRGDGLPTKIDYFGHFFSSLI